MYLCQDFPHCTLQAITLKSKWDSMIQIIWRNTHLTTGGTSLLYVYTHESPRRESTLVSPNFLVHGMLWEHVTSHVVHKEEFGKYLSMKALAKKKFDGS